MHTGGRVKEGFKGVIDKLGQRLKNNLNLGIKTEPVTWLEQMHECPAFVNIVPVYPAHKPDLTIASAPTVTSAWAQVFMRRFR